MDTEKIKQACKLMHNTGADDTQYILVRLRDLEELVEAWERDRMMQDWVGRLHWARRKRRSEKAIRDILEMAEKMKKDENGEKDDRREGSEDPKDIEGERIDRTPEESKNREMGDGGQEEADP